MRRAATTVAAVLLTLTLATAACTGGSGDATGGPGSAGPGPGSPAVEGSDTDDPDPGSGAADAGDGPGADPAGGEHPGPRREELVVPTDDLDLAATLYLPAGEPPYPGMVLIHGSGPVDRAGTLPGQLGLTFPRPVPVYEQLADRLAAKGVAVLLWDKRTCGPASGCPDNDHPPPADDLTVDVFEQDAEAALDLLAARDDVDELIVAGHSQGGTLAARIAARRGDLAAAVLLATPVTSIEDGLAAQADRLEELVAAVGQQGPQARAAVAETRELAEDVGAIAAGRGTGTEVGGVSEAFWQSWIDASREAPALLADSDVPVLVLGGELDWNVPAPHVEAWVDHLAPGSRVQVLANVTHALTRLERDDPAAIRPGDVGLEVDPAVADTIARWLQGRLDAELDPSAADGTAPAPAPAALS